MKPDRRSLVELRQREVLPALELWKRQARIRTGFIMEPVQDLADHLR